MHIYYYEASQEDEGSEDACFLCGHIVNPCYGPVLRHKFLYLKMYRLTHTSTDLRRYSQSTFSIVVPGEGPKLYGNTLYFEFHFTFVNDIYLSTLPYPKSVTELFGFASIALSWWDSLHLCVSLSTYLLSQRYRAHSVLTDDICVLCEVCADFSGSGLLQPYHHEVGLKSCHWKKFSYLFG